MSREVFLDTQGLIALLNHSERQHPEAMATWERLYEEGRWLCLTDWILAETGNSLARTVSRQGFVRWVETLQADPRVSVVMVEETVLTKALSLYEKRHDKGWGLVDCASFVVMKERGIREALTRDQHFRQAGFSRLLT